MMDDRPALIAFSLCAESWRSRGIIVAWGVGRGGSGWSVRVLDTSDMWHEAGHERLEEAVTRLTRMLGGDEE